MIDLAKYLKLRVFRKRKRYGYQLWKLYLKAPAVEYFVNQSMCLELGTSDELLQIDDIVGMAISFPSWYQTEEKKYISEHLDICRN